ncbi:bacteriophage protein gp37 [Saccharomonospora marina XMU15]|uniref:Bacteriophage protein gp37 n=1 Tax=Saccharomonospora marina XMU15 TaxID=882083 RepID=H5X5A7_9PSEU|nr:phage Gp37/Gp68 family protein [Saccharomonospora marina]EHR48918.1 bacteriophage protein gp37 [Saccharomonospora marina XMU15]
MSATTGIEWTDATWNPVTGCTTVSAGCDHCYAKTFAERWRGTKGHHFERGFDVQLRPDKLELPLRWRKPRKVFVNSMSDLFHADVPDEYIARVFAVMALTPQHTYQILTKRHARMRSLLSNVNFAHLVAEQGRAHHIGCQQDWLAVGAMLGREPLPNVWLGVSVENQQWADIRIPALLDTPAAVRFLSCEPLLGPVDLTAWLKHPQHACDRCDPGGPMDWHSGHLWGLCRCPCHPPRPARPNWVIAGGESGHGARPMHPDWARSLRDQCHVAGVPFLFKQWGEWAPDELRFAAGSGPGPARRYFPDGTVMRRVGKHRAGRVLDGRTWDEFPRQEVVA